MNNNIPQTTKNAVSNQFQSTIDRISTTGIYTALRQTDAFKSGKHEVAELLASVVENKMNERFHKSLNAVQKCGFISKEKIAQHQKDVSLGKFAITAGVPVATDLFLIGLQKAQEKREFEKYINFLTGAMAYVSATPSIPIRHRIEAAHQQSGYKFNEDSFISNFEKFSNASIINLPALPKAFDGGYSNLFMTISNVVDTSNDVVKENLSEVGELLGLSSNRIEECIQIANDSADFNSQAVGFSSLSMTSIFSDIFDDVKIGKEAAVYNEENDHFHHMREKRKSAIIEGGAVATTIAVSTLTGPVGDAVLLTALPAVLKYVSPNGVSTTASIEMNKRIRQAKKSNKK